MARSLCRRAIRTDRRVRARVMRRRIRARRRRAVAAAAAAVLGRRARARQCGEIEPEAAVKQTHVVGRAETKEWHNGALLAVFFIVLLRGEKEGAVVGEPRKFVLHGAHKLKQTMTMMSTPATRRDTPQPKGSETENSSKPEATLHAGRGTHFGHGHDARRGASGRVASLLLRSHEPALNLLDSDHDGRFADQEASLLDARRNRCARKQYEGAKL